MDRVCAAVVVERRQLLRDAFAQVVARAQLEVVASVDSLHELQPVELSETPLLVLLGLGREAASALQDLREHRAQRSSDRIVVLSDAENNEVAGSFIRSGADAYLDELISPERLLEALHVVLMGGSVVPTAAMACILDETNRSIPHAKRASAGLVAPPTTKEGPQLSAREIAVLGCLVDGSPNKVIAQKVDMAEATVKVHVKAILRKIQVKNRTQAAIWALSDERSPLARNGQATMLATKAA